MIMNKNHPKRGRLSVGVMAGKACGGRGLIRLRGWEIEQGLSQVAFSCAVLSGTPIHGPMFRVSLAPSGNPLWRCAS